MKKILTVLCLVAVIISAVACADTNKDTANTANGTLPAESGTAAPPASEPEGATTAPAATEPEAEAIDPMTLIEKIYAAQPISFDVQTEAVDLNDADALKHFTGLGSAEKVKQAAASEALIMPSTYSLVVVQAKSAADGKELAQAILEGIDPAKWVCVCSDDVRVAVKGDLIMLIMNSADSDPSSEDFIQAFTELRGEPDLILKK